MKESLLEAVKGSLLEAVLRRPAGSSEGRGLLEAVKESLLEAVKEGLLEAVRERPARSSVEEACSKQ